MRLPLTFAATALLALAGCATDRADMPSASLVNSLSFDNAMTGKRDGLRSAWPVDKLARSTEQFPMAQVKQCNAAGMCSWGVLKAHRSFGKVEPVPGGMRVELEVTIDVNRSHSAAQGGEQAAMVIPSNVSALQARRTEKRTMVLEYGKVTRLDLNYGIGYDLCVLRLDAARTPLDKCEIAYF